MVPERDIDANKVTDLVTLTIHNYLQDHILDNTFHVCRIELDILGPVGDVVTTVKRLVILRSMTKQEKENPELFDKEPSRITRVAKGAGVNKTDIKSLLKQYKMLSDMIKEQASFDMSKGMSQKQMQKLMKKFGKKKFMKF